MKVRNFIVTLAAAAICVPAAMAQSTTTPTTTTTSTPTTTTAQPKYNIDQRKNDQQQRIGNGVDNGSLTAGETHSLEKQESNINKEENTMRAEDNGHLTSADRTALNQQQNHMSKEIYQDKHNAAHQNVNPQSEVGQRQRNQQERIGQGIKSGQLTAGEASHLEGREAGVNHEIAKDRAANGGHLTQGEKAQINHQENHNSKAIYNKKHNARTRG
jgi:hypothetical protein